LTIALNARAVSRRNAGYSRFFVEDLMTFKLNLLTRLASLGNIFSRLKMRDKMILLSLIVFIGFLVSTLASVYTVSEVKVGGRLYVTIKQSKDALEQFALLKSDLNQIRAESLGLIGESDSDKRSQMKAVIEQLSKDANEKFALLVKLTASEEKQLAISDAQTTWEEFSATMTNELIPALEAGDAAKARELATNVQKMRYDRFIEQISTMVDTFKLEITELEAQTGSAIRKKVILSGAVSSVIFLIVLLAAFLVTRAVTTPLNRGLEFARSVAGGNLDETLVVSSKDEIGELSESLNTMVESLRLMVTRINASAQNLAVVSGSIFTAAKTVMETTGSQASEIGEASQAVQSIDKSANEVSRNVDTLSSSAAETSSSTLEMAASVEEVALTMDTLLGAVEEVSSSITQIAAAIKQISQGTSSLMEASNTAASSVYEMNASISEVEKSSREAAAISGGVLQDAEFGMTSAADAISGMDEIRRSSKITTEVIISLSAKAENIGAILKVITEVNEQTNLLALNAAIIAAQAGDHGKGFAVVAGEIKELADRTKNSTGEISRLINGVQMETKRAVDAISAAEKNIEEGVLLSTRSGEALQKIVAGVKSSTDQINAIARAATEQTTGSSLINESVEKFSRMVQQIGTATNEQAKVSDFIVSSVERMRSLAAQVRTSTQEQTKTSNAIAKSTEQITGMIGSIKTSCDIQATSTANITKAVSGIEHSTDKNLEAASLLDTAVSSLTEQTAVLQKEMGAFKLTTERDAVVDSEPRPLPPA
jgi:methyl-accepting chemotaxis protein